MTDIEYSGDLRPELDVALDAGAAAREVILDFYQAASAATYTKQDGSPVTEADLASDRVIRETISRTFPGDAFLTEEGAADQARLGNPRVWIVDPIDGTAQYVARTGQFDVLIALAVDGRPAVAVSVNPVGGVVYAAVASAGAWEIRDGVGHPFRIEPEPARPRIVSSKWYGGRERERGAAIRRIASRLGGDDPPILEVGYNVRAFSAANRSFDSYIGLPAPVGGSIAQEWDLACVDLITREAGGAFTDCWGRLHRYNKRSSGISGGILASGSPALHKRVLDAIAPELPQTPPAPDPADEPV